ncbi:hypothetical protein EYC84_009623 [Monilinia fructicola]|uniref:Uncharacterized protein n=1 Tax=Monilinia fructicola TaxID=38448 RepID=A0A5M9J866_MONFR|nr:hypothetical protein EYC84_009623 [Monilinia fructicola]
MEKRLFKKMRKEKRCALHSSSWAGYNGTNGHCIKWDWEHQHLDYTMAESKVLILVYYFFNIYRLMSSA